MIAVFRSRPSAPVAADGALADPRGYVGRHRLRGEMRALLARHLPPLPRVPSLPRVQSPVLAPTREQPILPVDLLP